MKKEHLEMILEDINGKFDLVLEGYAALDKKLDNRFDLLNEKIEMNSFKINVLSQKIDGVEEKLTRKIDGVEEKLTKKIDGVEEKLTRKIDGVEEKLTKKIDAVAADLRAHRVDTEVHRGYRVRED
jgi:archaellum component FlaC